MADLIKIRMGIVAAIFCVASSGVASATPPVVVMSSPDNGEIDVAPETAEIRVTFDQPMNPRSRSIVGGGDLFPDIAFDEVKWADAKTLIMPVKLQPDHEYALSINSDTFTNFRNTRGESAEWYPIWFKTRAANAQPAAPDVNVDQNKAALAALVKAIDEDYAYRDFAKVDWPARIAERRVDFEHAPSANAFARLAAHLLQAAHDSHVSVMAGDVRIGTAANSTAPNFNTDLLPHIIPGWKVHESGLITGRFEDGVGYLLFSECSRKQADGIDEALADLKDSIGLILDMRCNGGGDEIAAQKIAQHFVAHDAVYSRDRVRLGGRWIGPFDRIVPAAKDARYDKPVVVLIGPKVVSSAESFALMMKYGAKATLVGDITSGSSGRPVPHALGNGVTVFLSSWEDQLPDGTVMEGRGVCPDVMERAGPSEMQENDPVLEAGRKALTEVAK